MDFEAIKKEKKPHPRTNAYTENVLLHLLYLFSVETIEDNTGVSRVRNVNYNTSFCVHLLSWLAHFVLQMFSFVVFKRKAFMNDAVFA
jgi:hypothetical protein